MINIHHSLSFWVRCTTYTSFFFFSKKNFFLVWMDRQFAKDTHACCFNNYTTTILFIFFLAGTIDSLNRTRGKQNLHDWYVCFHVVIVINIEKSCRNLSHTCMHARAGLDFVSCHEPTKRTQPGGWQPLQSPQKVATSIYCIIIQPFSSHLSSRI